MDLFDGEFARRRADRGRPLGAEFRRAIALDLGNAIRLSK